MVWVQRCWVRLQVLFGRHGARRRLNAEIQFHLEQQTAENISAGMSAAEARNSALRLFGNTAVLTEETRATWGWMRLEQMAQDLRHGARMLRKHYGFTVVAVLTLALGIGANTAIFSYINAWMIKPLPYPQAGRLMSFESHDKKRGSTRDGVFSTASFLDFQKQNTSFEQSALWTGWNFNLTGGGTPELVEGGQVSWNFFDTLGARPILGRNFIPEEDAPGAPRVAMIGEGLWQSRYGGDEKIIGRTINIDGETYTIVGIVAGNFQFTLMGLANLWTPLALTEQQRADRGSSGYVAFGRLKAGVMPEQAGAEARTIFARMEEQFPQTNTNQTMLVRSMVDKIRENEGLPQALICFAMVGLVLLIACANVANLMLARASNRKKEFAMRGALGATKGRLVRQLLTESLLLFFLGSVGGGLFGLLGMRWIESQLPARIRGYLMNYGHVDLDATTLFFTLGIALLCGLVFGLAPAFEHSRPNLNSTLKDAAGQASGSKRSGRLRRIFVAAEISLAVIVLISTTLLVKSFIISVRSSPGYNPANVMVAQLALPATKYKEEWHQRNFVDAVLSRLHNLPQVASVAAASAVPFGGFGTSLEVQADDQPTPRPGEKIGARFTAVSPDYLSTMQISLVRGRLLNSSDGPGSAPAVVISETLAHQFWPHQDAEGRKLRFGDQHKVVTVVGVVKDIKMYQLRSVPERQIYVPLAQYPSAMLGFVVRTTGDPTTMAASIRDAIWAEDRDQPISSVEPLETLMAVVNTPNRILAKLVTFFGGLAMFLGVIGIYGVISEMVSQRTHEIGIRTALGARPVQMMGMVISQGLKLALIGVALGELLSLGTTRSLAVALYQVRPNDPLTFAGVPIVFALVVTAACYIPGRRAMRVDPIQALRYE